MMRSRVGRPDADDLAYLAGLAAGLAGLFAFGFVDVHASRWIGDNDFSGIWAGGRAIVLGLDPYDAASWQETAVSLQGQSPESRVYGYPGWIAVAMIPLGLLPVRDAALVWMVAGIALAAIAVRALLRSRVRGLPAAHTLVGLSLLMSQPALVAFYDGQWSFALLALTCVAILLMHRRPALAGLAGAAAVLAKPQLFLIALPALARDAPRRSAVAALALIAAAIGLSLALAPGWPAEYLRHVLQARLPDRPRVTTLPTALFDLIGPAGLWLAALALVALALASLAFRRGDARLAVALSISLAFAPYTWSYDQLLLLVPLVLGCGVLLRTSRARALALVTAGAGLLLVAAAVLHGVYAEPRGSESFNGLVSAAIAALVTALLWPHRHARLDSADEEHLADRRPGARHALTDGGAGS